MVRRGFVYQTDEEKPSFIGSESPIVLGKLSDHAVSEQILEQLQRSQKPRVQQASQVMKCLFRQRVITNGN